VIGTDGKTYAHQQRDAVRGGQVQVAPCAGDCANDPEPAAQLATLPRLGWRARRRQTISQRAAFERVRGHGGEPARLSDRS
jgi:hypothetical protein